MLNRFAFWTAAFKCIQLKFSFSHCTTMPALGQASSIEWSWYCLSYITNYIIIGRVLMKTLLFLRLDEYFYGSFIAAGDQRATVKYAKSRLVNVTALFYNNWRRSMLSRESDESKAQQKKQKTARKIRTLVSMPERDSLIQSSRRSVSRASSPRFEGGTPSTRKELHNGIQSDL